MKHRARFIDSDGMTVYTDILDPEAPEDRSARSPIVAIHGGGHTGACYLLTADNRPGWACRFAGAGYQVWLPDWPGCGRSGDVAFEDLTGERVCRALADVVAAAAAASPTGCVTLLTHSMSGALGWRIAELRRADIERIVAVAPGPPGNIQPPADVVSETGTEVVVRSFGMLRTLQRDRPYVGGAEFVNHKLIGKSRRFPDAARNMYAGHLAAVPPRLLYERQNVRASQVRVENTGVFAGLPVLVVTGSDDTDHPREIDVAVVDWLGVAGADAAFWWLPDKGIDGNGHMLMMEDNADEIADLILGWIAGATR